MALSFFAGIACAQSAGLSNIGCIEVQKVFQGYKETSKAQAELKKQEESFKKEFDESKKKLDDAEKAGKKKEDLEKMQKELEQKLSPKRDELLRLNEQLTTKIQQQIIEAVKKVAKKVGVDVVFDKQVVITGGMDLTEMVMSELNK